VKELTVAQRIVAMLEDQQSESDAEELGCEVEEYEEED